MNIKNSRAVFGMIILIAVSMVFLLSVAAPSSAESMRIYTANQSCEKQKAILRRLENTRPNKKITKKQIFNQIKAACGKMRTLDCPDLRNYQPPICFTDF